MDDRVRGLAAVQDDVVAVWQLLAAGLTWPMIAHRVRHRGWRVVHPGVYALVNAPLTRRQLWLAATLTTPDSVLSHASAAACWGIRNFASNFETITRPGSGGPRRLGGVLVSRSTRLQEDTTDHGGIKITNVARTVIDLAAQLPPRQTARSFREALRLKLMTRKELTAALERHSGRRGTRLIADLLSRYAEVPYERTRSDAEGRALELLHDAGVEPPTVNSKIAGEEVDLSWPRSRRIIEIDGRQYHQFPADDARKQKRWEAAGYTVRRIPSDVVYDNPARLIALARDD
jgi:Protein of unknown function (DUF559)